MIKRLLNLFILIFIFLPLNLNAESKKVTVQGDHGKLSCILQLPKEKKEYPLAMLYHGFSANKEYHICSYKIDRRIYIYIVVPWSTMISVFIHVIDFFQPWTKK